MSARRDRLQAISACTVLLLLVPVLVPAPAGAGAVRVPTDAANLQLAIDAAAPLDTVFVEPGTYTGPGNKDLNFRGKDIVVWGVGGAETTIIDCEGSATEPARGFIFESGEPHTAVVAGLTIRNGFRSSGRWPDSIGGGILIVNEGTRPTIKHCSFEDNHSDEAGGGVAIADCAAPTVAACRFTRNHGSAGGGGALVSSASATFIECEFIDNESPSGHGGGVKCVDADTPRLRDCLFRDNLALSGGALLFESSSAAAVAQCDLINNRAVWFGAGVCGTNGTELALSRCLINYNLAATNGGAVSCRTASVDVVGCTMYRNRAQSGAGICAQDGGVVTVESTIIALGDAGEAVACTGTGTATLSCCDLFDNENGDWSGCIASQEGVNGNMTADPLFCSTGTSDFHLAETSPCAPAQAGSCGLVGRFDVACTSAVEMTTWGAIKANYGR